MSSHVDGILDWLAFYEGGSMRRVLQFGSNTEVEEALADQDQMPVVFDDQKTNSVVAGKLLPWTNGFFDIVATQQQHFWVVCGVCSTPRARRQAVERIEKALEGYSNWVWYTVRSNTAKVSRWARVGAGALILDGAYVAPDCDVADHAVLLPGARIYHHSSLGDYSIMVGGSIVLGRVKIEAESWICGHATVLPGGYIAKGQVLGAGTIVKQIGTPGASNEND